MSPNIPTPATDFAGVGNGFTGPAGSFSVTSAPPDTTGAVGPNHYVQLVNTDLAVFNKSGTPVYGPVAINTLWSGFGGLCQADNDGDPIVRYDPVADRWLISQFAVTGADGSATPFLECVAISQTPDPTGAYNRYSFPYTGFNDYPKISVWPDGYYVTYNMFNAAGTAFLGGKVCALDRTSMLVGQAATQQCFDVGTSFGGLLTSGVYGSRQPPAGSPNYVLALGASADQLAFWKFHVDWATPANSTLTGPTTLATAAFSEACGGGTCIPQEGTTQQLDSLADRLMDPLVYRNFGDHEALVVNHSVTAGSSSGVRWYEIRSPATTPTIFQQGTYAPDGNYRWMGSIGVDQSGNMGLGFSLSGSSIHPEIHYTGRLVGDPAGTMGQGEGTIINGTGSQSGSQGLTRWGDYSNLSVDPTDDCTFWYTNEYLPATGEFNWSTRIGSFKFPGCGGTVVNDFSISANPTSLSLAPNTQGTSTISTAVVSGAGTVGLAVGGTPPGATASLSPTSIAAGNSSTLTVNAGTAAAGTYTLTVTGTEGTATHAANVTLTVTSPAANDFSISANPTSLSLAAGASGSSTISTSVTSGSAGTVSLTVSGAPAGAAASLNPTSITAGSSSTLTVNAGTAAAGTYALTVTGTEGTATHAATVTLTVTAGGGGIVNGDFEAGTLTGWTVSGQASIISSGAHGGSFAAEVGSTSPSTDSSISQDFIAPVSSTSLSLWYQVHCPDTITYDWASAVLTDQTAGTSVSVVAKTCTNTGAWTNATATVTPGHSYTLSLANHDDNYVGDPTYTWYDDVIINTNAPPPGGITNGGFESGLAGWTPSGTAAAVTSPVHTGSFAAQLGSPTSPTNGDSSVTQTFIAPAGSTILSFWYRIACPDTVTYDWATATLKDNTSAVTTTPLAKACSNDGTWHQVTTPVTSGHSYTLTLASHDDNYAGDPTATWYDDVSLPGTTTSTLVLSPATAQVTAGSGQPYAAKLVDGNGNVMADVTTSTSFAIAPDGSCSLATCTPVQTGSHTVSGVYKGATATASLTATAGPVASLQVRPPSATIGAGGSQPYQIEGFDALGNDVGDVTPATTLAIGPDGACITGSCTAQVAGTHTVSATDGTATRTATLNVVPGPVVKLSLTPPAATISAGGSQPYQVEGFDAYGNDLGDVTGGTALAVTPDGTCGTGSCTAQVAGPHTVNATDGTAATSGSLQVNAGALSTLAVAPAAVSVPAGAAQPFMAEGFDGYGNDLGDVTAATVFAIGPDGSCSASVCRAFVTGPHTIAAIDGSATGSASLTVTVAATTVTLGSSLAPAALNQPVTLTAVVTPVSPATGVPTGKVTFLDGSKTIGSGSLFAGSASVTLSFVSLGSHHLTARYDGDPSYAAATSAPLAQVVVRRPVTVTITAPAAGGYGSAVPLTATVIDTISGAPVAGDRVSFKLAGQAVAAVTDAAGTAAATLTLTAPAGSQLLSASVASSGAEAAGGASQPFAVAAQPVTLALTGAPLVTTASPSATTASVAVSVRLTQGPGAAGDLSRARVSVLVYQAADVALAHPIPVGPLSPGPPAPDGSVTFTASRTLGVGAYVVRAVTAAGNRYFGGASDFATLTVARPRPGPRVDGAGVVTDPATAGQIQATSATDTAASFALSAHGQATPTGTAIYTFADSAGRLDIIHLTVATLTITQPGVAVLTRPATITTLDPATGQVATSGGYSGTVTVNDGGTGQPDSYAITVLDPANNLWHQAGTPANPLAVLPDSIVVTPKV